MISIYITSTSACDYFYIVENNTYVCFNKYSIIGAVYDRKNGRWIDDNRYIKPNIKERIYLDLSTNWLDVFDNIILNQILDNI